MYANAAQCRTPTLECDKRGLHATVAAAAGCFDAHPPPRPSDGAALRFSLHRSRDDQRGHRSDRALPSRGAADRGCGSELPNTFWNMSPSDMQELRRQGAFGAPRQRLPCALIIVMSLALLRTFVWDFVRQENGVHAQCVRSPS